MTAGQHKTINLLKTLRAVFGNCFCNSIALVLGRDSVDDSTVSKGWIHLVADLFLFPGVWI